MLPALPGSPGPQDVPCSMSTSPPPTPKGVGSLWKRRGRASHAGRMRGDSAAGSQGSGHTNSPSTPRGGRASADGGLCGRTERGKGPPDTHQRLLQPAVWVLGRSRGSCTHRGVFRGWSSPVLYTHSSAFLGAWSGVRGQRWVILGLFQLFWAAAMRHCGQGREGLRFCSRSRTGCGMGITRAGLPIAQEAKKEVESLL